MAAMSEQERSDASGGERGRPARGSADGEADSMRGETPAERYCPTCERSFSGRDRCPEDDTVLVRLAAPTDRLVGSEIDARYTIQRRIGSGGMGAVYGAVQHSVGREVAIKVVNPSLVDDPFIIKRFLREAKLTSRLAHPNAVAVLDFGQTPDGLFYLVMELITGRTLAAVLKADGAFSPARVVRIGSQILDALAGAHQLSIIHRDLKPSNVIVLESAPGRDLVKVLDFGLAKSLSHETTMTSVTGSGALLGTPAYMPPEVATGGEADARGDLYSLGVILYQLASGRLPFVGESVHELLIKLSRESAPPLESFAVPAPLARVIEKMMARSPADRYPNAALAQAALDRADDETSTAPVRRLGPVATPLSPGDEETLPATPRGPLRLDDSDALASTHHGSAPLLAGMAPTPAPVAPAVTAGGAETPAPIAAHRSRRRVLLAMVGGLALVVVGVSIALGLGGGDASTGEGTRTDPAAPAATGAADAQPLAGEPAVVAPPPATPISDAAPTTLPPPRRGVRDRRERRRERVHEPRPRRPDAGYPF
jgi:serine/threonine protein kinase